MDPYNILILVIVLITFLFVGGSGSALSVNAAINYDEDTRIQYGNSPGFNYLTGNSLYHRVANGPKYPIDEYWRFYDMYNVYGEPLKKYMLSYDSIKNLPSGEVKNLKSFPTDNSNYAIHTFPTETASLS